MEILEQMTVLYHKFSQLKVDKEEYVIMKVINFLNQGEIIPIPFVHVLYLVCREKIDAILVCYCGLPLRLGQLDDCSCYLA